MQLQSLDPIDDVEDHARHDLRLPPAAYDAVEAAVQQEVQALRQQRDSRLPPDEEQLVRYRKQLVEGSSVDDVKWLKLRAYHRAMDQMRLQQQASNSPAAQQQRMDEYEVPLDLVPKQLLDLTPEQLADRWQGGAGTSTLVGDAVYSEDSEWPSDWASTSYLHNDSARGQLLEAFVPQRNVRFGVSLRPTAPLPKQPLDHFGSLAIASNATQPWQLVDGYTAEHLNEVAMERKLRIQQRQRSLAFWLPLAAVLGTYVVRGIRRLMRPKGGAKGGGKARAAI